MSLPHEVDERTVAYRHEAGYRAFQVIRWLIIADLMLAGIGWRPAWWTIQTSRGQIIPMELYLIAGVGAVTELWYRWRRRIITSEDHLSLIGPVFILLFLGLLWLVNR
ncbi:MAG: hypothetical protein ACOY93_06940 [Bacillota bacterium]